MTNFLTLLSASHVVQGNHCRRRAGVSHGTGPDERGVESHDDDRQRVEHHHESRPARQWPPGASRLRQNPARRQCRARGGVLDDDRRQRGGKLNGQREYVLHFPAGQLPPNEAFWSLTMTDVVGYMVRNPIDRYSVGSRSGLMPNADGSIDIYIQRTAPAGHESNWLPAPAGNFKLMLRAYLPGRAILDGEYHVPPVKKVR